MAQVKHIEDIEPRVQHTSMCHTRKGMGRKAAGPGLYVLVQQKEKIWKIKIKAE